MRFVNRSGTIALVLLCGTAFTGCHPPAAPVPPVSNPHINPPVAVSTSQPSRPDNETIATVNNLAITRQELEQPLLDSYGLNMLLNIMQLRLAKQQVAAKGLQVSPADVQNERSITFATLFADATPADYDALLDQFLRQRNLNRAEFDMMLETNAYLRKLAEPQMPGHITDEMVHQAFGRLYGENRQVRDIEVNNMRDIGEAKRRLHDGIPFEQVAATLSQDPQSRGLGGELPPFSIQSPNIPQAIKDSAFSMQPGQVSDAIADGQSYHLIKLEKIIPPKIVKYDDVKDSVKKELEDQWMELAIKQLRGQIGQLTMQTIVIADPVLKAQWAARLDQQQAKQHDRVEIRNEIDRNRAATTQSTPPTTAPAN